MVMFAKVVDGKITKQYNSSNQYIDDNGVRFPVSIWENTEFLKSQSISKVQQAPIPDTTYYLTGESILAYDTKTKTVLQSYSTTEKSTDDLKKYFNNLNLDQYKTILLDTNYHIIRSQEDSAYKVPTELASWRETINKEFDTNSTNIEACGSISDFQKLNIVFTEKPTGLV